MVEAIFVMDERTEHLNHYRTDTAAKSLWTLKFHPVHQGDGRTEAEKALFRKMWDASPAGRIELGTINPEAAMFFQPGQAYRVVFEKVPEPVE